MSAKLAYRPDIDGIRAIAVCAVVFYHAFPTMLPGGFVGVDIFFVLSGFLITGILAREYRQSGRVDFADFYARRVRRLLPALIAMIAVTLMLGLAFIPPIGDLQSLGESAASALIFASNIFFLKQHQGYFDTAAEVFPLLHTWTLAVEEQFYIGWPFLIIIAGWAARKIGRSFTVGLTAMLLVVFVVSIGGSIYATTYYPNYAFYLTPFRAWEFAIGAGLSLIFRSPRQARPYVAGLLSLIGLAAILVSLFAFDSATAFPGYLALLPTLGTVAMLAGGGFNPRNSVSTALGSNPFAYIGKISYGWYLWHWPFLAILRSTTLGQAGSVETVLAVAASFIASMLSFHFIETPIRLQRLTIFRTTGASLIAGVTLIATGVAASLGTTNIADRQLAASPRLQMIARTLENPGDPTHVACRDLKPQFAGLSPVTPCLLGDTSSESLVILLGDSHAAHLVTAFDSWGKQAGVAVLPRFRGGCRPLIGMASTVGTPPSRSNRRNCSLFRDAALAEALEIAKTRPTTLIVAARWPDLDVPVTTEAAPQAMPTLMGQSIAALVDASRRGNFGLVLVKDTPLMPYDVPRCLARYDLIYCSASMTQVARQRDEANRLIEQSIAVDPRVASIDPSTAICDERLCYAERSGQILYWDPGHLTNAAGPMLAKALKPQLDTAICRSLPCYSKRLKK